MAYPKNKTENGYTKFNEDLKSGSLKNVMLFFGVENYLMRWAEGEIKKRFVNPAVEMFDYTKLDSRECSFDDIMAACETMPMMSEKKVVTVEWFSTESKKDETEAAESTEDDSSSKTKDAKTEEVIKYIQNVPESTMLIFIYPGADKRKKLYKGFQKHGAAYEFERLESPSLKTFITKRLRSSGKKFDTDVSAYIAEASGYYDKESSYTLDNLINDIEKIIAHSGEYITVEDAEETVSGNEERDIFAFSDAASSGRKGEALSLLNDMLSQSRDNVFPLLGLICNQFEVLLQIREMLDAGMTPAQMHDTSGIHEFRIKKLTPIARRYSVQQLRHILLKAYEADRNIKTGLISPEMSLELFVGNI